MAPNDRSGRRDPVFGDANSGRPAPSDSGRGPRFTLDDDDSADRPRAGASDIRADARDEAVWRARNADYDDLYEDQVRRPPYMIIGGILAVLGVAGGAWFFYNRGMDRLPSGPPPLIQAEAGPTKIAPDQPGGAIVPNQDKLVYSRVAGERYPEPAPGAEELLPRPEEPKRLAQATPSANSMALAPSGPAASAAPVAPVSQQAEKIPVPAAGSSGPHGLSQAELAAQVRANASGPVEISGDRTPKGAANANDNTPPPPVRGPGMLEAPKGMAQVRPTGEAAVLLGVPPAAGSPETATAPSGAAPGQPINVPASVLKPASPAPAQTAALPKPAAIPPAATGGGNAMVQLGALPDHDVVEREWDRLVKKHGDLLGGLKKLIVSVDIPGRGTMYRLRVTGLKDARAAQELCAKLKARDQPCLVP